MKMKKLIAGVAVAALPFGIFVGQAAAETATDSVDVYAGLAPVMELSCSDVNFGVWRVPTGTRSGGATTVTLTSDSTTSITSGSSSNIALSANYEDPAVSSCTVTGSAAADDTVGQVGFTGGTGSFATNGGTGFNSETLAAPSTVVSSFSYSLTNTDPVSMSSGATSFKIHGTMSIPDNLVTANYGGYKAAAVTVTYSDVD
jgi:hypothetical protein